MRVAIRVMPAILASAVLIVASAADWFDHDCVCCKPMHENQELMSGMKWEVHKVDKGMMLVVRAPEGMMGEFRKCCAAMHEAAASAAAGDPMCGFCASMGDLQKAGAKMEVIDTEFGDVTLVTASDPMVVEKIHSHADKTQEAMDHMAAHRR